jgi:hypothetical protein
LFEGRDARIDGFVGETRVAAVDELRVFGVVAATVVFLWLSGGEGPIAAPMMTRAMEM